MNNNVMSVLFASGNESKLNELTLHRTTASLPFGGRYRLIDFALSGLVNHEITKIGIITRSNYSSLMDHIRMGRDWDLNRKNSGIAVFPPFVLNTSHEVYRGKVEALYTILDFFKRAKEEYVVLSNCNIATNFDLGDAIDKHIESGKDITVVCHKGLTTTSRRVVLKKSDDNTVTDIYLSETVSPEQKLISLNLYVVKKDILMQLVENAYARGHYDFEKDVLFEMVAAKKVNAYEIDSYAAIIDDVKTYYNESMKLLEKPVRESLFEQESKIYTKVKDSVPTIYEKKASVKNSLIADGCVINGVVEDSILFRGVQIEEGAVVKNSIVMEGGLVSKNASLRYAITDKDVVISEGREISGYITYPIVIVKGKTV